MLPPAKNLEDMQQVVTNATVDGILAAIFALLVVAVIADAARIWIRTVRRPEEVTITETPPEPSRIFAPAGLFPTAEEREQMAVSGRPGT